MTPPNTPPTEVEAAIGADLDYLIAKTERGDTQTLRDFDYWKREVWDCGLNRYSTNWAHGGPIIERERITLASPHDDAPAERMWQAVQCKGSTIYFGPTPLVAAMRAVADAIRKGG